MAAKRLREPIYVTLGEIDMFKSRDVDFDSEDKPENDIDSVNPATPTQEESECSEGSEYSEEFEKMDDDYDDYVELGQIEVTTEETSEEISEEISEETTISSNTEESTENQKGPSRRLKILGVNTYFTYFLLYVTVIQSCMKAIASICIMSMHFNFNLDASCQGDDCPKPVPVEKRAAYFLPCLAVFGISTFHFGVGVWMFSRRRLTVNTLKLPMTWFAIIIGLEMAALYVILEITNVSLGVLICCGVIVTTEMVSVLVACCYPHYRPLNRRVTEEINLAPDNAV